VQADAGRQLTLDAHAGVAQVAMLAAGLVPPCPAGPYALTGRIARTSNALVYTATGGVFGDGEGVLKLTGSHFAPLLERELRLLNRCREEDVDGVVRPDAAEVIRLTLAWPDGAASDLSAIAVAMALPFLSGGDLAEVARSHATRDGRLGPDFALQAARRLLAIQRALLALDRPIVHGDVKLQNILLPVPAAPLSALTLIDFDAARELDLPLTRLAEAPAVVGQWLADDVRAFGEVLYELATGREARPGGDTDRTANPAFDVLVRRCVQSSPGASAGYVCLADEGLRYDLQRALDVSAHPATGLGRLRQHLDRLRGSVPWPPRLQLRRRDRRGDGGTRT
jgi:hypothetical protein